MAALGFTTRIGRELPARPSVTKWYGYPSLVLGWRIFLVGVFLTPAFLLTPLEGIGVSFGDVFLLVGAALLLVSSGRGRVTISPAVWVVPGLLLIVAALISGLANEFSSGVDTATLVTQYGVTLVLLPVVLAGQPLERVVSAAKAFVYGLAVMVAGGLLIVAFLPGVESAFLARGWMVILGGDRHGLFSGVSELSKISAMSIGVIYYLGVRGHIGVLKAGGLLGAALVALIVARSAGGVATAVVTVGVVAVLHLVVRANAHGQRTSRGGGRGLLVGILGVIGGGLAIRQLDLLGAGYTDAFLNRIADPFAAGGVQNVGSARLRGELISQAWSVIGEHPLVGIGPGLYHQEALLGQGVHVVPLMLWAETGLLALLGWVVLIVGLTVAVARRLRRAPIAAVAAGSVLSAMLLTHLSAPYLYGRPLLLPMLITFFLLADETGGDDAAANQAGRAKRIGSRSAP